MKKALVVGYGSIGARHAKWLTELGLNVSVVSKRTLDLTPRFYSIEEAFKQHVPDYVVIANRTSEHFATFEELARLRYRGVILVEKPLFEKEQALPANDFKKVLVGYNLRFHPVLLRLKELVDGSRNIIQVQTYCGKYLPTWRPGRSISESANKVFGGGVLRDLSHELDYLNWIFGGWNALTAVGGHFSHLEIDSDDAYSFLIQTKRCKSISLQLNYLDRVARREIIVNTDEYSIKADLINGTLSVDDKLEEFKLDPSQTYRAQHEAILTGSYTSVCSYVEGYDVMRMIEASEYATENKVWVERKVLQEMKS